MNTESIIYTEPDLCIPEDKKDKKWYMQYARYWSTFYNCDYTSYITNESDDYIENLPPIDRARKYALYYSGKQENLNYNHLTQDVSGNSLPAKWIKGKKIHGILNHLVGTLSQMLANKELTVENLSPDIQNNKTRLFNQLMFRFDNQGMELFKELNQLGVNFNPMPGQQFDGPDSVERFMEYDWKETGQVTGTYIAKDVEERNLSNSMYIQAFLNYAAANYCAVYNYAENGFIYQENIPFQNLIYVPGSDEDPFNRTLRAAGFYKEMTPNEVLSKYGDQLDEETIKKIKEFNSKGEFEGMEPFNEGPITYFNNRPNGKTINVLKMFWIGEHDLRFEQSIDKDGELIYTKNKDKFSDKRSSYIIQDIHQVTLIGNIDAVDFGYSNNVIRDSFSKNIPELPIKILTGRTLFNSGVSIIGKIAQNQDKIDALRYKIMEMVGRAKGKSHIINGDVNDVPTSEFVSDLSTIGIHVRKPSGNQSDVVDNKRTVETIDWTLDPNITLLRDLYLEEERIIEEAVSVSKVALGMQSNTVGKAVQQNTISRSTLGLATIYEDFVKFNEINLQYAMNLSKIVLTADGDYEGVFAVGDRQIKWMKITKEFSYSDLLLLIKVKDSIDEASKVRLQQYAFAWMQNPDAGNTMLSVLRLEQAKSWTQAINDLEYSIKSYNRAMMMQQQAAINAEIEREQRELENKTGNTLIKENNANQRAIIQADAMLEKEKIKEKQKQIDKQQPQAV